MRRKIARLYDRLRRAVRVWAGDDDYDRYLRGCAERGEPPLDRGRYFAQRLEEHYHTAARCC